METPIPSDEPAVPTRRRHGAIGRWLALYVGLPAALALGVATFQLGHPPGVRRENVWSIAVCEIDSPSELASADLQPILTAASATDVPALFVADPFLIEVDATWYLFMEVMNKSTWQGDIAVATSRNRRDWEYQQVVLDEPFHMSYPFVFAWDGAIYMVPESEAIDQVRLYRATRFPTEWELDTVLLRDRSLADATLFLEAGTWWMFAGRPDPHDTLRLFHASDLRGPWQEHVASPIVAHDPNSARPGGRVVSWNGSLYRLGQDCDPRYGNALRAFAIQEITQQRYRESDRPIELLRSGEAFWNPAGMHHADLHFLANGRWMAAVDGHRKEWIIGW